MKLESTEARRYAYLLSIADMTEGSRLRALDEQMRALLPRIPGHDMAAIKRRERAHAASVPGCEGGWDGVWRKTPHAHIRRDR